MEVSLLPFVEITKGNKKVIRGNEILRKRQQLHYENEENTSRFSTVVFYNRRVFLR